MLLTELIRGGLAAGMLFLCCVLPASEYIETSVESDIVPSPVQFAVLLPDGYDKTAEPYPLLLNLHGGGGSRDYLKQVRPIYDEMWREGALSKMVVVTPSVTPRCFYMDYKDGSQKWETFIAGPFLEHLRAEYNVRRDKAGTLLTGISMGGQGTLRLAFKHPDKFGAVAVMEPGIDPVIEWEDIELKHRWWRAENLMREIYGNPFDAEYWEANNPATIVARNPDRIRAANLSIYLECGDEDFFWLYEATEFMHRVLYDNKIRHEYHLVRWADHVGATVGGRTREALGFLELHLHPAPPDPVAEAARKRFQPVKNRLGVKGHFDN